MIQASNSALHVDVAHFEDKVGSGDDGVKGNDLEGVGVVVGFAVVGDGASVKRGEGALVAGGVEGSGEGRSVGDEDEGSVEAREGASLGPLYPSQYCIVQLDV
jgi:hypothetical protein